MSDIFTEITEKQKKWIRKQKIFFVSTSPLSADGHVNCSPKGLDSFRVLGKTRVAYLDFVGSGVETISHIQENERICIMMCAFDGTPKILRLHGKGKVAFKGSMEYEEFMQYFGNERSGIRSVIYVDVTRVSESCGYSVPIYQFVKDRDVLDKWIDRKGEAALHKYVKTHNKQSIDGIPGVE